MVGRHQHARQPRNVALAGQMSENLLHVAGEGIVGGEVAQVGVKAGGARVVIAG